MAEPTPLRGWNPKSGTAEPLTPAELERRFKLGDIQLVEQDTYPMATGDVAAGGDVRLVKPADVQDFLAHGYRFAEHHEVARAEARNDPAAPYKAFAEGAFNQVMLGYGDKLRVAAGADPDAIQARQEEHSVARNTGGVVGAVGGTLALGALAPGALTERAGIGMFGEATGSAGRLALDAAGGAAEGAVRGTGDAVSEAALGRTDVTAQALLAHGGLGALVGGLAGPLPRMGGMMFKGLSGARPRVQDANALLAGAGQPGAEAQAAFDAQERAAWAAPGVRMEKLRREPHVEPPPGPRVGPRVPGLSPAQQMEADAVRLGAGRAPTVPAAPEVAPNIPTAPDPRALVDDMAAKAVARRAALGGIMGGIMGNLVGHPMLGAEVGAMLGGAARPGGQLLRAARAVSAVREYVDAGVESFMAGTGGTAVRALPRVVAPATLAVFSAPDPQSRAEAHAARMEELSRFSADPQLHTQHVAAATEHLRDTLPDTTTVVNAKAHEALQLLQSAAPRPLVQPNPMLPEPAQGRVPDSEVKRFAELDAAVQDPMRIIDQLRAGRVPDPAAVAAVRTLYPAFWSMVSDSFQHRVAALKGGLSNRARIQASLVFGVTTHPSLTPESISVSQSVAVSPPATPTGRGGSGRRGRSLGALQREDQSMMPTKLDRLLQK